jgi:hypothetical protein
LRGERRAECAEITTVDLVLSLQVRFCAREWNVLSSRKEGAWKSKTGSSSTYRVSAIDGARDAR